MPDDTHFWVALAEIVWINILLSGDNAVVIALACRSLPEEQRKWGILLGVGPAVVLRIVFTVFVGTLLAVPFLKLIGAALLLWIAVKLMLPEDEDPQHPGEHHGSLWAAARTIIVADAVMSLDNVIAIAAAAQGRLLLLVARPAAEHADDHLRQRPAAAGHGALPDPGHRRRRPAGLDRRRTGPVRSLAGGV